MVAERVDLMLDGYAGRRSVPAEIVGETPKRYRVKLLQDGYLSGRNNFRCRGEVVLVPKSAVRRPAAPPQGGEG